MSKFDEIKKLVGNLDKKISDFQKDRDRILYERYARYLTLVAHGGIIITSANMECVPFGGGPAGERLKPEDAKMLREMRKLRLIRSVQHGPDYFCLDDLGHSVLDKFGKISLNEIRLSEMVNIVAPYLKEGWKKYG